jgi:hypothetical protein
MAEVGPLDPRVLQNVAHEAALSDEELGFIRALASPHSYFDSIDNFYRAEDQLLDIVESAARNANAFLYFVYTVEKMRQRERLFRLLVDLRLN